MEKSTINDRRLITDFSKKSFSGYKKTDVKKILLKELANGNIEATNYWSAEMICSGYLLDLWECILLFMSKNINMGNPNISKYIELRYGNFKNICTDLSILDLRNNEKIRLLFSEIITILCLSKKKYPYTSVKIQNTDFEIVNLNKKLKAENGEYAKICFKKNDSQQYYIALNELVYHLLVTKNHSMCFYWIEWIMQFCTNCKKKKMILKCESRTFIDVEFKYKEDVIWVIWEIFMKFAQKKKHIFKNIKALLNLFCIKYKLTSKKKRKFLMYFAVSLLLDEYNHSTPIFTENEKIENIKKKINVIYKEVKKNEIKPKFDYLLDGF